jgi:sortase B
MPTERGLVMREKRELNENDFVKILFIVMILMAIISIGVSGFQLYKRTSEEKSYVQMRVLAQSASSADVSTEQQIEPQIEGTVSIPIDFQELQKVNSDIYAWITIPGTVIDYPIVQRESEDLFDPYYLNHTAEQKKGVSASIYTEGVNMRDFSDYNTVVYGHNMRNGTMFHNLRNYRDKDFLKENDLIFVYTSEHILTYKIAAFVIYDDRHIIDAFNFANPKGRGEFIESITASKDSRNCFNKEITIQDTDQLLTLSTCIGGEKDKRALVLGVLTEIDSIQLER